MWGKQAKWLTSLLIEGHIKPAAKNGIREHPTRLTGLSSQAVKGVLQPEAYHALEVVVPAVHRTPAAGSARSALWEASVAFWLSHADNPSAFRSSSNGETGGR